MQHDTKLQRLFLHGAVTNVHFAIGIEAMTISRAREAAKRNLIEYSCFPKTQAPSRYPYVTCLL